MFLTQLPGKVKIAANSAVALTQEDMSRHIRRGEALRLGEKWFRVSSEVSVRELAVFRLSLYIVSMDTIHVMFIARVKVLPSWRGLVASPFHGSWKDEITANLTSEGSKQLIFFCGSNLQLRELGLCTPYLDLILLL